MIFSFGNIITVLVVLIILVIYRQIDRGNRSLEKVKRFSDRIANNLNKIVEQRTAEIRNLSIELKVNLKTGKEILKRVREAEEKLNQKAEDITRIQTKLTEYDRVLDELIGMTGRVDENLDRIRSESIFVDKVGKMIKNASAQLENLQNEIPQIQEKFSQDNQQHLLSLSNQLFRKVDGHVQSISVEVEGSEKRVKEFSTYITNLEARRTDLKRETEKSLQKVFEKFNLEAKARRNTLVRQFVATLNKVLGEADKKGKIIKRVIDLLAGSAEHKLSEKQKVLENSANKLLSEVDSRRELFISSIEDSTAHVEQSLEENHRALEESANKLILEADSREQVFQDTIDHSLGEAEERLGEKLKAMEESASKMLSRTESREEDFNKSIDLSFTGAERRLAEQRKLLEDTAKKGEALEEKVFSNLKSLISRDTAALSKSSEALEKKLAEMDAFGGELKGDLNDLKDELGRIKNDALKKIDLDVGELQSSVFQRIDQKLENYEGEVDYRFNKLQEVNVDIEALEANLRQAMGRMSNKIKEDFNTFAQNLAEERKTEKEKASEELEFLQSEMQELEKGLSELKSRAYQNVSEQLQVFEDEFFTDLKGRNRTMEERVLVWQNDVESRILNISSSQITARESIEKKYTEELKGELERIKRTVFEGITRIENHVDGFEGDVKERILSSEKSISKSDEKLKVELESIRRKSLELINQDIKSLNETLEENLRKMSSAADESLRGLRDDFAAQRDELIISTKEERTSLKSELKTLSNQLIELENGLRKTGETARKDLQQDLGSFQLEFVKKTKHLQGDMESRLKDLKKELNEIREKTGSQQKSLFGKIDEGYNLLNTNLADLDKRTKDFVAQTKLFERADGLKLGLEDRIGVMKKDIGKLQGLREEVQEIENRLSNAKKTTDEVNSKLSKLQGERRRVEDMDSEFKKLITISRDLDLRIEAVYSSQDTLQEIQSKIRELENMGKLTESRYERLEKKKSIIETTTAGADKSFQMLDSLEKNLGKIGVEVGTFGEQMKSLKVQTDLLSNNKDKADAVVDKLEGLDTVLEKLEARMEKLDTAREWLARTETRFQSVGKQAQEQVRLLESILKKESADSKLEPGAPSMDKRETVIKLAHRGWKPPEIARTTHLSRGEVELILELAPKK